MRTTTSALPGNGGESVKYSPTTYCSFWEVLYGLERAAVLECMTDNAEHNLLMAQAL